MCECGVMTSGFLCFSLIRRNLLWVKDKKWRQKQESVFDFSCRSTLMHRFEVIFSLSCRKNQRLVQFEQEEQRHAYLSEPVRNLSTYTCVYLYTCTCTYLCRHEALVRGWTCDSSSLNMKTWTYGWTEQSWRINPRSLSPPYINIYIRLYTLRTNSRFSVRNLDLCHHLHSLWSSFLWLYHWTGSLQKKERKSSGSS